MDNDKWVKKQFIWNQQQTAFGTELPSDLFVDSALCLQTTASTTISPPCFTLSFLKSCLNLLSTTKYYKSDCCKMPAGQ